MNQIDRDSLQAIKSGRYPVSSANSAARPSR
jgi:hypothetical protein